MAEEVSPFKFQGCPEFKNWKKNEESNERLARTILDKHGGDLNLTETDVKSFIISLREEGEEKIIESIKKASDWRTDFKYPSVLGEPVNDSEFYKKIPLCIFQAGKYGHPVYYIDIAKLLIEDDETDSKARDLTDRANLHLREISRKMSELAGNPEGIWRNVVVLNMDGIGLLQAKSKLSLIQYVIAQGSTLFGTNLQKCFLINCGWSIRLVLALIMPFLQEETKKKVVRCGSDYLKELKKSIAIDRIPKRFGGKASDDWVSGGIIVPKEIKYEYTLL